MKPKKLLHLLSLTILCIIVSSNIFIFSAETTEDKNIPLDGTWCEGKRSVSDECPVSVILDSKFLFIQTTSFRSTIIVRIMRGSTILHEETIQSPAFSTSVCLDRMGTGNDYRLELTNQWGDYLSGEFSLE